MSYPGLVTAALAVMFVLLFAPTTAFAATGDAYLTIVSGGSVLRAARSASGAWTGFSRIPGVPGQARSVDEVMVGGQRNLMVLTSSGLYHSVLTSNGWGPFSDIVGRGAGQPDIDFTIGGGGVGGRVSAANAGGVLHVVLTGIGQATHTYRDANGGWARFNQGALRQRRGHIRNADATGLPNGQLYVAVSSLGKPGTPYHAVRFPDGTWSNLAGVPAPAGLTMGVSFVSTAALKDQVHVVVTVAGTARVYDAIRYADGTWTGLTDITGQTGPCGGGPIAASGDGTGQLHIVITGYPNNFGLLHSVRLTSGRWTALSNVKSVAGELGPAEWVGLSAEQA